MADLKTQREELAKEYDALQNRLFLIQIIGLATLLAVYQFSGASAALAHGLAQRFGDGLWYVTNACYMAVSIFGFAAFMMPLSYYSGHVVEHYYELSDETFGDWMTYFIRSLMIDLVLATLLFSVIYALLRVIPGWWWAAAAVFYILFAVVLSSIVPVIIMPLFHTFEPLEEGALTDAIRKMMTEAGIDGVGIFRWGFEGQTATANTAFFGFGKNRRIILDDTLLSGYSQEEILAILAHEIGHYKNKDSLRLMLASSVLALLGFFVAHHCMVWMTAFFGLGPIYNIAAAPAFIFSLFIFSLVSMPVANMHSRHREFAADAYAIESLGASAALISAFEKLADQTLSNKEPAAWVEFLLHSHPSMARRIDRARSN
ncbi:MAG: M48 family metallopeptidase [Pontiella sp.]